jgi:hypothetical protein
MNVNTLKQNQHVNLFAIIAGLLFAVLLFLFLSSTKASAATITVGGACTLDDAVASMNAGSDQSGCTGVGAYGTSDTVTLPSGTFPYTNADAFDVPVTIQGAGISQTIIDCGATNEGLIFDNLAGTDAEVIVQDLSIQNPDNSPALGVAAIETFGFSLTVRRVEIFADTTQEVEQIIQTANDVAGNTTVIEDVYIRDLTTIYGAVIINAASGINSADNIVRRLTVNSVVATSGNGMQAVAYGLLAGGGTVSGLVENATFTGLTATAGSNISYINAGANSTFSNDNASSSVTARNITIVSDDNSGDVHAPISAFAIASDGVTATAEASFQNLLGAGMTALGGTFTPGLGGTETATLTSLGGNIIDGVDSFAILTEPTDQSGVTNLASSLGSLQDNGGLTPTIALLSGSPAIDAGVTNSLTADQRGTSRPQGSAYDSGAFELAVNTEEPGTTDGTNTEDEELANTGQNRAIIIAIAAILALPATFLVGRRLFARR